MFPLHRRHGSLNIECRHISIRGLRFLAFRTSLFYLSNILQLNKYAFILFDVEFVRLPRFPIFYTGVRHGMPLTVHGNLDKAEFI